MPRWRQILDIPALLAAFLPAALLAAAWIALRPATAAARGELLPGWLLLLLFLTSFTTLFATAARSPSRPLAPTWLSWALLADLLAILLLAVAWDSGLLRLADALKAWLVIAAWLAFLTAAATLLRRFGPGLATAGGATLAAALLGAPVLLGPLARTPIAGPTATAVSYACPTLGTLAGVWPSLGFTWQQAAVMYNLTPLGQDVPLALPLWWLSVILFAVAAVLLGTVSWWVGRSDEPL